VFFSISPLFNVRDVQKKSKHTSGCFSQQLITTVRSIVCTELTGARMELRRPAKHEFWKMRLNFLDLASVAMLRLPMGPECVIVAE
jgi:hypothetical protein